MLHKILAFGLLVVLHFTAAAQYPTNPVKPSSKVDRLAAVEMRADLIANSPYLGIAATSIGPTIMSGRVVDVAVNPMNTKHFFVAYATGGVWESKNNGHSFTPIFDNNGYTIHCGAIAVDWAQSVIYVGTGESNSSRSSYSGYGLFKCYFGYENEDKWKTWEHIGLEQAHHISKIIIHPNDPKTLYVAAMSALFSENNTGGVYKTANGGESWNTALTIGQNTSAVDLEIIPENPDTLIAAIWQRARRGWDFTESGELSGIYITGNGGKLWTKSPGFVSNKNVGRIGLSIGKNNVIYALLDNQDRSASPKQENDTSLSKKSFIDMTNEAFLALSDKELNAFLDKNRLAKNISAKKLKKSIKKGTFKPKDLYDYFYDANAQMFDDPVNGAELYRSDDLGASWYKTHDTALAGVCYSYGYYFGVVQASMSNPDHVFIAGVPLLQSADGGTSFTFAGGDNVHVDHHYIWINPRDSLHLINGNDGGINISYDGGQTWTKCNSPAVGQFYTVAVDDRKKYNVYGGLQDNGTWKGPNSYKYSDRWHQEGKYPYTRIGGGDGMQIQIDPRDNTTYTGYQYGHYMYTDAEGKKHYIHPKHKLGKPHLRWNWQTPILLSKHNPSVLYIGSNKLHRSTKQYKNFKELSPDLTHGARDGDVSYGTLATISESPLKEGMLYTGSDDGLIHFSANSGKSWSRISDSLPQHLWVKEVLASRYSQNRVYAALNGHNWDHFNSYLYVSKNNGTTWEKLGKNLPNEPINTIIEDPNYPNIIYLGTDAGLYLSTNSGKDFQPLADLPPVAVHDLAIQENHRDLIVATHGRSLYKIQLEAIYQSIATDLSTLSLLPIPVIDVQQNWGTRQYNWEVRQPSSTLTFFAPQSGEAEITIMDAEGNPIKTQKIDCNRGYNQTKIILAFDTNPSQKMKQGSDSKYYPTAGIYSLRLNKNGTIVTQTFTVK